MKIKVVAPVYIPGTDEDGNLDVPEGSRVRDVLKLLSLNPARLLPASVNGVQVSRSRQLQEGDMLVLIFPISGG